MQEVSKFVETLSNAGFKPFKHNDLVRVYANETAFQKRVRDADGHTKYFIRVYVYGDLYSRTFNVEPMAEGDVCFMPRGENEDSLPTVWATISFISVENLEETVEKLWVATGSHYYERDDD